MVLSNVKIQGILYLMVVIRTKKTTGFRVKTSIFFFYLIVAYIAWLSYIISVIPQVFILNKYISKGDSNDPHLHKIIKYPSQHCFLKPQKNSILHLLLKFTILAESFVCIIDLYKWVFSNVHFYLYIWKQNASGKFQIQFIDKQWNNSPYWHV